MKSASSSLRTFVQDCVDQDKLNHLSELRATSDATWTYFEAQKAAVSNGQKQERLRLIPALEKYYKAKAAEVRFCHQLVKQVLNENQFNSTIQTTLQEASDELQAAKYTPLGFLKSLRERRDIFQESALSMEPSDVDLFLRSALARYGRKFRKKSGHTMRAEAIAWLGFGEQFDPYKPRDSRQKVQNFAFCWCPVNWKYVPNTLIASAYRVPAALSAEQLGKLLGKKHSIVAKDNLLPISTTMERLWNENAFTIVPQKKYSQTPEQYKIIVLQDDIPKKYRLAGDMSRQPTWPKDYHNRSLQFPCHKRPSKTYLYIRHCWQLFYMADKGGRPWVISRNNAWKWIAQEGILSRPYIKWLAAQINNPDFATVFEDGLHDVKDFSSMEDYEVAEFAAAALHRSIRPLWLNLTSKVPPALSTTFFPSS